MAKRRKREDPLERRRQAEPAERPPGRGAAAGKRSRPDYKMRAYYLETRLIRALDVLAALTGRDRSELVNEALREHLARHRDKLGGLTEV